MYDKSQLMRGTLEGCILKFLSEETTYGYELVEKLEQYGFEDIKEGIIDSQFRPSPLGPSRKYYSLTTEGAAYLEEFLANWTKISSSVNQIFRLEG